MIGTVFKLYLSFKQIKLIIPNTTINNQYTYGKDNLLTKYKMAAGYIANYTYDGLNRLTKVSVDTSSPIDTSYTYYGSKGGEDYTTNLLETETINGVTYKYDYDTLGNITDIYRKNNSNNYQRIYQYKYDAMNQLTYVSDFENRKIYNYTYDNAGNIISEVVCNTNSNGIPISTTNNSYTYGDSNWMDKLTAYNGQTITYDAIGNPLSYRDGIAMTWKNGRQLTTLSNESHSVSYSYDSNSVRVSKTVDGVKYTYEYLNGKLLFETRGEAKFWYSYDSNGILYNIRYTLSDDGTMMSYYCTHNSRGDIIGIYNGDGILRAQYKYDAWGNVLSVTDENGNAITSQTHIGNLNPFRYRGYYYDTESGFYYLMSRYYDPVTHRFINADGYFQPGNSILDANMHSYCGNNPVNNSDPTGEHSCGDPTCPKCNSSRRAFLQTEKGIKMYNNAQGTDYVGVNDNGDFIARKSVKLSNGMSVASNAISWTRGTTITAAGYFIDTAGAAAGLSGLSYAVTTPLNIVSHSTNPYLTDNQKRIAVGEELLIAGIGIGVAALMVTVPVAGVLFAFGWTMATYGAMTMEINYWEDQNKKEWGCYY